MRLMDSQKAEGSADRDGDSFQLSHLAFLQAGRESSSTSDVRGFFTVEIIPKAVFLVSIRQTGKPKCLKLSHDFKRGGFNKHPHVTVTYSMSK